MIQEIKMFGCFCDNCGDQWDDDETGYCAFTDAFSMKDHLVDDTHWHTLSGTPDRHYCPECFTIDDNDNLIIKPKK